MRINSNVLFEKHKKSITLVLMLLFMLCFLFYQFNIIGDREYENLNATIVAYKFLVIAILATICVFGSFFLITSKRVNIETVHLVCVITLGIAYMFIFLPHTVPDEPVHYFNAYGFSNYFTFNFEQSNVEYLLLRQSDFEFFETTATTSQSADYYYTIANSFSMFSQNNNLVEYVDHSAATRINSSFGYIFSGLGIAFARLFRLSPILTYYSGRFFNILSYAFMSWWAIKKIPYGKMAIFAISVLPMSLHLIASYSYDSQVIAFSLLFVAQLLYMLEKDTMLSYRDLILCTVFGMLLAPSKLVYLPVAFLIFIIPKEKLPVSKKWAFGVKMAMVTTVVIFMFIMQLDRLIYSVADYSIKWSDEEARSVSWILKNPLETVGIYIDTLFSKANFYFGTLFGSSLGWFQINISSHLYAPFYAFLLYSFLAREGEECKINFGNKLWALLLVVGSVILIFTSMLISWTPKSYETIEGVQGRYFIPLLIVAYMIIRNRSITVKPRLDRYAMFALLYWNLFVGIQYFVSSFV